VGSLPVVLPGKLWANIYIYIYIFVQYWIKTNTGQKLLLVSGACLRHAGRCRNP